VVLQNNGGDNLSKGANGSFTFATSLNSGATYAITVFTQPSGQTCTVTNGSGTVGSANVTGVTVNCLSSIKTINSFNFNGLTPAVTGTVTESNHTIALTVPFLTNVTALVPTITITGASVSPNTGVAQNFTTSKTYTVTAADNSTQAYTVTVTMAASLGLPTATGVTISGTKTVGQTLTGSYTFSDPNGKTESGTTYQWFRAATSGGTYSAISGATSTIHVLVSADIGQYLKFQVTPKSASGTGSSSLSSATSQINSSAVPTVSSVSISGTLTEGLTLTGSYTYSQTDGVAQGVSTFRWLESATSGGTYSAINGATSLTYALTPSDVGKYIKFEVTPVAIVPPTTGSAVLSSNVGPIVASSLPVASVVVYTGTETVGHTLTGTYTYSDSGNHPQASSTFRWLRSTTQNGTYSAISSATSQSYILVSSDIGKYIKFEVTPVSTVATGVAVTSNPSGQINSSAVPIASSVSISGIPTVGQTLTGNYTYSQADGVIQGVSTFRWLESLTSGGIYSPISGATSKLYVLESSDSGNYLKFEVTPVATVPPTTGSASLSSATTQVVALSGDSTAPSIPTNVTATPVSTSEIYLSWVASTDDTGVTGYNIYRNGTKVASTTNTTYSDIGLSSSTQYTYTVSAYDAVPNESAQSTSAVATTQTASSGGGGGGGGGGSTTSTTVSVTTATPTIATLISGCTGTTGFSITTGKSCSSNTTATNSNVILGCDSRTTGFSTISGKSCVGNTSTTSASTSTVSATSPQTTLSSTSLPYSLGTMTLKKGSKGPAVKELQRFLNDKLNLGLVLDGVFGSKTTLVIKKWQSAHGLNPDGLVGPKTKALMNSTW
jgi:hypothetical protein